MTREEAIRMLKAKLECMIRDVSGSDDDCNRRLCGECPLNYEQGNMGEQKKYLQMSIEALEHTRWIPVDDRLPEPWESVLITFSGKYGSLTADHAVGIGSWDGANGWYFEEIQGYTDRLTVEAWMNLPESYKGE